MTIKVILVDDSAIVRALMARALTAEEGITIVANAANGARAIPLAMEHKPDVIILDIEMPEMDGLTALPHLLKTVAGVKVIMASSLTHGGAEITMRALAAGASDYIAKPLANEPGGLENFHRELRSKIFALTTKSPSVIPDMRIITPEAPDWPVRALAVIASTGGPQILQQLFEGLKGRLNTIPIFITQHMPVSFTAILAANLGRSGDRNCIEGRDGDIVKAGSAYIAPGNYHMLACSDNGVVKIRLSQDAQVNFCRPAADPMLQSLASIYGRHLLTVVLTGMGRDGLEGCKAVVAAGGAVIAQNQESSAVWSMPKAVATNGLCRALLPPSGIADYLLRHIPG